MRRQSCLPFSLLTVVSFATLAQTDVTIYGRVNVSVDVGSQGLSGVVCTNPNLCNAGSGAQGNLRWIPDISSNLSRIGVRASHEPLSGCHYRRN